MKIKHVIKNFKLVERNRQWLTSGTKWEHKLLYYPAIALSYLSMITRRKSIYYLGAPFFFDNPATPLNLQVYPYEISRKILSNMPKKPTKILDIGGNIGQFSRTLLYFTGPKTKVDIIEPNPVIFKTLEKNLAGYPNVKTYNSGLDGNIRKRETRKLYFQTNRSATGSFIKQNAGENAVQGIDVEITGNIKDIISQSKYDLVKIDVEGFEIEVLRSLKGLSCKYLFLEISGPGRKRNYSESDLYEEITRSFGRFKVLYASGSNHNSVTTEVLLMFMGTDK